PGGAGDLEVGAAEDGRDEPRDDRGDEAGGRTHAGGDAEAEGEGQGDDADGDPGEQVGAPRPGQAGVVRTARQRERGDVPGGQPPGEPRREGRGAAHRPASVPVSASLVRSREPTRNARAASSMAASAGSTSR